jgi:hypothetical protein
MAATRDSSGIALKRLEKIAQGVSWSAGSASFDPDVHGTVEALLEAAEEQLTLPGRGCDQLNGYRRSKFSV